MQSLQDNYFFDYEISNHNILVLDPKSTNGEDSSFDFQFINQILPLQYRVEYSAFLSTTIYEEEEFELNETLLVKKVIFLLIALALDDGVQDFKTIREMSTLYRAKK